MDATTHAELLRRLADHYARFDRDARTFSARVGTPEETGRPAIIEILQAATLTPRELSVLELVAEGFTDREIGEHLVIGEATVKTYVRGILIKLSARNRTHAVMTALRNGYIALEDSLALAS